MDQYGQLYIWIDCIKVVGPSRAVISMRQQVSRISCTRSEAQAITNEHGRQANASWRTDGRSIASAYTYDWQPQREEMTPQ